MERGGDRGLPPLPEPDLAPRRRAGSGRFAPAPRPTPPGAEGAWLELRKRTHRTTKKVTDDIERFHFNTAISAVMELVNHLYQLEGAAAATPGARGALREAVERLLLLLQPFTPHFAAELWERIGGRGEARAAAWPGFDPELLLEETLEIAVQVNGKVRGRVTVPAAAAEEEVRRAAFDGPAGARVGRPRRDPQGGLHPRAAAQRRRRRGGARVSARVDAAAPLSGRSSALALAGACGYRIVGIGGQLPGGITRVEVPVFENHTSRSDVGRVLTEDFISELLGSAKLTRHRRRGGAGGRSRGRSPATSASRSPSTRSRNRSRTG